jgi:hypothetical protein
MDRENRRQRVARLRGAAAESPRRTLYDVMTLNREASLLWRTLLSPSGLQRLVAKRPLATGAVAFR